MTSRVSRSVADFEALAADELGRLHVGYYHETGGSVRYARGDASGWHIETVDGESEAANCLSVALDAGGRPYVSYHNQAKRELRLASRDEDGWDGRVVSSGGNPGRFCSVALHDTVGPAIAYFCEAKGTLRYALDAGGQVQRGPLTQFAVLHSCPTATGTR